MKQQLIARTRRLLAAAVCVGAMGAASAAAVFSIHNSSNGSGSGCNLNGLALPARGCGAAIAAEAD